MHPTNATRDWNWSAVPVNRRPPPLPVHSPAIAERLWRQELRAYWRETVARQRQGKAPRRLPPARPISNALAREIERTANWAGAVMNRDFNRTPFLVLRNGFRRKARHRLQFADLFGQTSTNPFAVAPGYAPRRRPRYSDEQRLEIILNSAGSTTTPARDQLLPWWRADRMRKPYRYECPELGEVFAGKGDPYLKGMRAIRAGGRAHYK